MNQKYSKSERYHVQLVKELPCSVCDQAAPSDAHHVRQDSPYTCVALCRDCHQGAENGWHGRRAIWNVYKMDELDALNTTLKRLAE